ncbi:CDP-glycerol glycerophosphotransferase family protein [Pelagibacteraceae bacterium]|jgi:CDP-glycerol glycerophosphotransferase (TagB/SpsB family)|nr:CDP-glycerol glycerophosphotransferase family protein [Pelagibacteraceae bacterium]MDC1159016.1 CDP-glycerol glycerophosphotransferase family protein [Pelagibacteraceae bacterium]
MIKKIGILINWPREIDMYFQLIKAIPNKKIEIIVNDIKSREKGRNNSHKSIVKILNRKQLKYKFFSKIYKKKLYKILISTGEACSQKITTTSLLKFLYARTIGLILKKTNLKNILVFLFNKPLTAESYKNSIGSVWYPENEIGKKVIKFPDGMDLKTKNYPYPEYKKVFDSFLTLGKYETKIIKKKFKKKECFEMGYLRYENLKSKKKIYLKMCREFGLDKQKRIIYWTPTHIDGNEEFDNVNLWMNKINILNEYYNIIIRPHPKSLMIMPGIENKLKKLNYFVDKDPDRKIGEIFKISDFIISDFGGTIFSAIYLNKPILVLNLKANSEFTNNLKENLSLDQIIRKQLISLPPVISETQIKKIPKKIMSQQYKKIITRLKEKYFGLQVGNNINLTKDYLLEVLKKNRS